MGSRRLVICCSFTLADSWRDVSKLWGTVDALLRLNPLILCLRRRRMTHLGSQLLSISDCQLTVGEQVTDVAVSQQSQRARLSEKLLQGASCVHGECTVACMALRYCFQ